MENKPVLQRSNSSNAITEGLREIATPEVKASLLKSVFKDFSEELMKQAIVEAYMTGFNLQNFMQKDIYAVLYRGKVHSYSLMTSIGYARKIGMRSGVCYVSEPSYKMNGEKIESCSMTIKRQLSSGTVGEYIAEVYFDEYYQAGKTWDGKYTESMWDKKPRTMIAKVAEMHALRKACPEEMANMYVEEEGSRIVETKNFTEKIQDVKPDLVQITIERIKATNSGEELREFFGKIGKELMHNEKIQEAKNEMKAKFEEANKPKDPTPPEAPKDPVAPEVPPTQPTTQPVIDVNAEEIKA